MAYWVRRLFGAGQNLSKPLRCVSLRAISSNHSKSSELFSTKRILCLDTENDYFLIFKSEPSMIWSTVKNNILSTKWLFFSGTFKKTKYFGSQNSSNHLSEVAVEKKALWFSSCFLKIRNFLTRPLTLIETHYEITYLSLVDKFVLEVSKWWSMRSTPYVQQLKEKERKEKRLGEKAYIFTIGCSFEDNASQ